MALFRRRKVEVPELTGHSGDDELLALIARQRHLDAPRHWVHYLYFENESGARAAASEVTAEGWSLQTVDRAASGDQWVVIPERHDVVTSPRAVAEARDFFEGVASRYPDGEYDGWEASV
jgi:hypothetical protein